MVALVEVRDGALFVAEDLDDLLALDGLLNEAIDLAETPLLVSEVLARRATNLSCGHQHEGNHPQRQGG